MSRIFSPEEPYPAAVITLASGNTNYQNILFQTRYDATGLYSYSKQPEVEDITKEEAAEITGEQIDPETKKLIPGDCNVKLEWAIKNISVSLFRDWSISEARVVLTAPLNNINAPLPNLPNCYDARGGKNPYLTMEDEIRIYMGYVDSPNTIITPDMLDEVPISLEEFELVEGDAVRRTKLEGREFRQPDYEVGKLVPVFWGFIDKIDFDGSNRGSGNQIILSCRDRGRILSDTTLINVPSLAGAFKGGQINTQPTGALWEVASDVAKAVNGYQINVAGSSNAENLCWKRIITPQASTRSSGLSQKELQELAVVEKSVEFYSAYTFSNNPNSRTSSDFEAFTKDPSLFVRRASFKLMDYKTRPRFHMWLNRPPIAKKNGTSQWQILDKTPLSIIKWIAANEEKPLDFFTSHVNGDFCLVPRVLDVSGFYDENRMYRTYFYRDWPRVVDGKPIDPPCENQLILNIRTFSTTIATANRITIVDNSSMAGNGVAVLKGVKLTVDSIPFSLSERTINPPCRLKLVYDGNLSTYSNTSGGALIVAMAYAAQFSRDIGGCEFSVLGDPTFYPGEAVRVYNTYLHDSFYKTQTGLFKDVLQKQNSFDKFAQKYSEQSADAEGQSETEAITLPSKKDSETIKEQRESGTRDTAKDDLLLPVYKVRSVEHKLSTSGSRAGYITTVLGSLDLNN